MQVGSRPKKQHSQENKLQLATKIIDTLTNFFCFPDKPAFVWMGMIIIICEAYTIHLLCSCFGSSVIQRLALIRSALLGCAASARAMSMWGAKPPIKKGAGSQPSIQPPDWWPKWEKIPITHIFRAMRPDMDDLMFVPHACHAFDPNSDEMKVEIMSALVHGSKQRSPFLHGSISLSKAHRWSQLAQEHRGEEVREQVLVKIDLWAWYQSGGVTQDMILDLSSPAAMNKVFKKGFYGYGDWCEEASSELMLAVNTREILLKWRGSVPVEVMEVVDLHGESLGKLEDLLKQAVGDGRYNVDAIRSERTLQRIRNAESLTKASGSQPRAMPVQKPQPPPKSDKLSQRKQRDLLP